MNELKVFVVPSEQDVAGARDGVEDLAFDAATGVAQLSGIELASDEFNELYYELVETYTNASKYLLYFLHMGILTVKTQMESGIIRLIIPNMGEPDPVKISEAIIDAAKPVAACLLHAASAGHKLFLPDSWILQTEDGVLNLGVDFELAGVTFINNQEEQ